MPPTEKVLKKKGNFICSECDNRYTENKNLLRHLRKAHNKNVEKPVLSYDFKCIACEKAFTRRNNLARHIRTTHKKDHELACQECLKSSQTNCIHIPIKEDQTHLEFNIDDNLSLENYPTLKNMLPVGYTYKLKEYSLLHKENHNKAKEWFTAKVQFYCKTVNEAKKWKDIFEEVNKLLFRVRSVHHSKGSKVHSRFRCHHNTHPKRNSRPREKHTACPALFTLTVEEINTNVLKTNVKMLHKHNHLLSSPSELKFRRPGKHIIDKFKMLFSIKKLTVPQALKNHRSDLEAEYGEDFRQLMMDRAIMPDKRWAYSLYYKCFNEKKEVKGNSENDELEFVDGGSDLYETGEHREYDQISGIEKHEKKCNISIDNFKHVCDEMIDIFCKDPLYFQSGIKNFISNYNRMKNVKTDLLSALHKFGELTNGIS